MRGPCAGGARAYNRKMRPTPFLVVAVASLSAACPSLEPLAFPDGCQPLYDGSECYLPYPSDAFAVPDDSMPTGHRIEIPEVAVTLTAPPDKLSTDMHTFWVPDGFSTNPGIVFALSGPKDETQVEGIFGDYDKTTLLSHPTSLIDAETGALVPHFVDIDPRGLQDLHAAIVIRPMRGLSPRHRYVVAVHDWRARGTTGLIPAPPGFARLRDGRTSQDPALEAIAGRYESDVFAVTDAAGIDRSALQLAWDFTTGSDEHVLRDMLEAKAIADEVLAASPPEVEIEAVFDDDPKGWRVIKGNVIAPLVLENNRPRARLVRDPDGHIAQNGTALVPFTMVVPYAVRDRFDPGQATLFGHGFFGSRSEIEGSLVPRVLEGVAGVGIAIDWWGMSSSDIGTVISTVGGDVSQSLLFTERVPQAMINWLTVIAALKGPFQTLPAFQRPTDPAAPGVQEDPANPGTTNAGALVYDPAHINYLGLSLGHILGGVLCTLSPDIERVVLNVGGAAFGHMMYRSNPFLGFLFVLNFTVPDPFEQQKIAASFQTGLDRIDPARYAPYMLHQDLPLGQSARTDQKRVLVQTGKADTQVPNFASLLHARLLDIPILNPDPVDAWGLEHVDGPVDGSALTVWDMGVDDAFYAEMYPQDATTKVHDALRLAPEVQAQMGHFFATGEALHPCDGPCVVSEP